MPAGDVRIFVATSPIDFRKGMDGLAGHIANSFQLDPYSGAIFVFRSRRADRMKLIVWDGTGLIMVTKRMHRKGFVWPIPQADPYALSKVQFAALFEGGEWRRIVPPKTSTPKFL
ncbi:IS66 family insertion sequence element accessory protein TnpB [Frigidibacter sp. MR17.24]|uniref:IS66 family insertion sequence element accessory protein TnpB n=1 Tax=Frigidibacter sp. MR17.24 TaxID=3127345 RepID=UPI003012C939